MIYIVPGDCLQKMAMLPAASLDAVVTDPPYGLAFMGKAWDHGVPGAPFWQQMLRLLKPGAHLVAFAEGFNAILMEKEPQYVEDMRRRFP